MRIGRCARCSRRTPRPWPMPPAGCLHTGAEDQNMNILVTGGAGYIGSATAEALLASRAFCHGLRFTGHRPSPGCPRGRGFCGSVAGRPADAFQDSHHGCLRGGHALRGLHRGRRVDARPGAFLFQQPGEFVDTDRDGGAGGHQAICALVHRRRLPVERSAADRRVTPGTNQCLRSYQADGGTGPGLVSPDPRIAFRRAALFQRLRRPARTRRGASTRVASHSARAAGGPRQAAKRRPSSARTIPPPMAPASATTSTLRTWCPHICWLWMRFKPAIV